MSDSRFDAMRWNTLSSRTIIKDRWVNLRADDCQMADGTRIAPFYVNEMPDFVVVAAVTEDGKFLMIYQYRHAVDKVILEIPAGCVEPGEEMEAAAARELLEETGYEASGIQFLGKMAPNASCMSSYAWCYLAVGARRKGRQELDETEEIAVALMTEEEVRKALRDGQVEQAVHVGALYWALEALDKG
ncbi:MAG: NUDIX hydrolase [Lachnospiraceae bacterium]|nr:NUDIX hydrolase [Lachnospiraceae bacterium]